MSHLVLASLLLFSTNYTIDDVRRTVMLTPQGAQQARISKGAQAHGGDRVQTGWFSYALIGSETHRAKFEIFSATEVTLADGTPGVILSVERGRIRAAFDKITGSEPRVVKTPGALLAVRGTQFDVEVDNGGQTIVDVFEGTVEVQSPLRRDPMFVRAGEETRFGPRQPPSMQPIPQHRQRRDDGQRNGEKPQNGEKPRDGERPRDGQRPDGGQRQPPPSGGMQPPQQPSPQPRHNPPPNRPPAM